MKIALTPTAATVAMSLAIATGLRAQCPDDRPVRLSLGVAQFHCAAGWCKIYGAWADGSPGGNARSTGPDAPDWDFSIEPVLTGIDPDGPAAGKIHERDVLVAVNGRPIVSQFASRVLDSAEPGDVLRLTVRRDGQLRDVDIETEASCRAPAVAAGRLRHDSTTDSDMRRLIVAARDARDPSRDRSVVINQFDDPDDMGRLGLALACYRCIPEGRIPAWQFREPPVVVAVLPGGPAALAGLQPGDVILRHDSLPITNPEAALRFGRVAYGETLRLTLQRGASEVEVEIQVTEPTN